MKISWSLPLMLLMTLSLSCIHIVAEKEGYSVKENHKQALIYHDGELSHLILKTNVESEKLPKSIAWVIPLAAEPSVIQEAPKGLFKDLYDLTPDYQISHGQPLLIPSCSVQAPTNRVAKSYIKVSKPIEVGNYSVTNITITDPSDQGAKLNQWLKNNGFSQVKGDSLNHYLKKGRCFTCVKMKNQRSEKGVLKLPALHLAYKSNTLTLPLKFSTHSGVFDVDLYVISAQKISESHFKKQHLNHHTTVPFSSKKSLTKLRITSGYIHRFTAKRLNSEQKRIANIASDPKLARKNLNIIVIDSAWKKLTTSKINASHTTRHFLSP